MNNIEKGHPKEKGERMKLLIEAVREMEGEMHEK
jgi:hypothetical protein